MLCLLAALLARPCIPKPEEDIWLCALKGNIEGLGAHLEHGAEINEFGIPRDRNGKPWGHFQSDPTFLGTPLHYAASYGQTEAVHFLLQRGARSDLRSSRERTALDYAMGRGYSAVCAVLKAEPTPRGMLAIASPSA